MPDGTAPEVKKGRKFDQVMQGARDIFLAEGFEGASVDDIARAAGVSKATLYSYFPDKKLLFLEVASAECRRQADMIRADENFDRPPREFLSGFGHGMLEFMLSGFGLSIFRVCVAESERFPELGRKFMESGPMTVRKTLIDYLGRAIARGELAIEDRDLAADQFAEMCKAMVHPRMLLGVLDEVTPEMRNRVVDGAVATFMARYGT